MTEGDVTRQIELAEALAGELQIFSHDYEVQVDPAELLEALCAQGLKLERMHPENDWESGSSLTGWAYTVRSGGQVIGKSALGRLKLI